MTLPASDESLPLSRDRDHGRADRSADRSEVKEHYGIDC